MPGEDYNFLDDGLIGDPDDGLIGDPENSSVVNIIGSW